MPMQMPPHAYAEWQGCLRWSFPRLGAYARASMYLVNHGKSASGTLPSQQESTLLSHVPTHTYAECKISGQQPTQLHKEFGRIHNVGHSKSMLIFP